MKKITLTVDEKVFSAVRQYAAARSTSVNQLVRDYLAAIADREDRAREARKRIRALSDRSGARIGGVSWTREELHER